MYLEENCCNVKKQTQEPIDMDFRQDLEMTDNSSKAQDQREREYYAKHINTQEAHDKNLKVMLKSDA